MLGLAALVTASLFTGAAFYVNVAEHPARMTLPPSAALAQWKPAYDRGLIMQSSLAIIAFLLGAGAGWLGGDWRFYAGAAAMIANWPYTLLVILPLNNRLKAQKPEQADASTMQQLQTWNGLHAVRTVLGALGAVLFFWALI